MLEGVYNGARLPACRAPRITDLARRRDRTPRPFPAAKHSAVPSCRQPLRISLPPNRKRTYPNNRKALSAPNASRAFLLHGKLSSALSPVSTVLHSEREGNGLAQAARCSGHPHSGRPRRSRCTTATPTITNNGADKYQNPVNGELSKLKLSHPRGSPQKLSRGAPPNRSNDPTFQTTSTTIPSKIFGRFSC
jgi:hypothetical protein